MGGWTLFFLAFLLDPKQLAVPASSDVSGSFHFTPNCTRPFLPNVGLDASQNMVYFDYD